MHLFRFFLVFLLTLASPLPHLFAAPADPSALAGSWEGAIELPSTPLEIQLDLVAPKDGVGWTGSIDIPAQMLRGLALAKLAVQDGRLAFELAGIPGRPTFAGELEVEGRLAGEFRQNGRTFPFRLSRRVAPRSGDTPGRGVTGTGLTGHWQGSLRAGPAELRLVLHVQTGTDGALTASLDSLDQNARDLSVAGIALREGAVSFEMPKLGARYEGRMSADGSTIEGQWRQATLQNPLVFRRLAAAPELRRPQEPKPPLPYATREVSFPGGSPGVTLAGTLTIPSGSGPFPAVALVSGSGPQDRDEALLGHRPFLVLADHLTRRGILVLRFDDRGVGRSTGQFAEATHHDFAADARAAFSFLKAQPEARSGAVGLCGHSEGGLHVAIAATQEREVAFLVLLAGIGVKPEELLLRQRDDFLRVTGLGATGPRAAENRELTRRIFALARERGSSAAGKEEIAAQYRRIAESYPETQREGLGLSEAGIVRQVATVTTPWFVELLRCDPAPIFARVRCPVFALNGTLDIQVAATENLAAIRRGIEAGQGTVETRALPGLNHLFQHCRTGAISEYGSLEETVSPEVLSLAAEWILGRAGG